jgi:hypothetical protein
MKLKAKRSYQTSFNLDSFNIIFSGAKKCCLENIITDGGQYITEAIK